MSNRSSGALLLGVLLSLCLALSGCEFKDIDKRFFVTAIGVDKSNRDKKYRVSLKIAIPKGQLQMGQEDYLSLALDSDSISDAIQKLKARVDKELDFGHTRVLVIGEGYAKDDYREPLDWFTRQRFLQRISWVVVGSPTAEKLLDANQKSERLPANALILAFGGQGVESQYIVSQYLFQFFRKCNDPGESPILPIAVPEQSKDSTYYTIDNVAVFDNQRLALTLTPDETRYYNIISGIVDKSDYIVKTSDQMFTVHADKVHVKKKIQEGSAPSLDVKISFDGLVEEGSRDEVINMARLQEIERATEKKIAQDATTLLKKLQAKQLDPVGFGTLYRVKHWEDMATEVQAWRQLYPQATINVSVKCTLRSTGTIQ